LRLVRVAGVAVALRQAVKRHQQARVVRVLAARGAQALRERLDIAGMVVVVGHQAQVGHVARPAEGREHGIVG